MLSSVIACATATRTFGTGIVGRLRHCRGWGWLGNLDIMAPSLNRAFINPASPAYLFLRPARLEWRHIRESQAHGRQQPGEDCRSVYRAPLLPAGVQRVSSSWCDEPSSIRG